MPVAWRAVNGDAVLHQPLAGFVNIIDLISEVSEISPVTIRFRVPIIGELKLRAVLVAGGGEEEQREAPLLTLHAPHSLEAELVAKEVERPVDIRNAHHGMQILHGSLSLAVAETASNTP
jgi:hypothetical protein